MTIRQLYSRFRNAKPPFIIDRHHDPAHAVYLAGTIRSGTTWLSELINYDRRYRFLFEPFHPQQTCWPYPSRHYIPEGAHDPVARAEAAAILSGEVRSPWIDQFNHRMFPRKRLIKAIHSNFFLQWMHDQFPEVPILLLVRHPCAIAHSMEKLKWKTNLNLILGKPQLMHDFFEPQRHLFEQAPDQFAAHILLWCAENHVLRRHFRGNDVHVMFYENVCLHPEREIARLYAFLGARYTRRIERVLNRPSALSRKGSAVVAGGRSVDPWKAHVSADQLAYAMRCLEAFGLADLYGEDAVPGAW